MTASDLVALVRKKPLIFGCSAASLILAGVLYFRGGDVGTAGTNLDTKSSEARRYALNIANASGLQKQFDDLVAADKTIESRMIRASQIGINQQYFFKLESDSNVTLLDLHQNGQPGTPPRRGGFVPIGFSVSVQGDFGHVLAFLRSLEDGDHYCRILSASCNGGRKGPVTLSLDVELLGTP